MSFKVGPIFVQLVLVRQLASKEYLPDFLFLNSLFLFNGLSLFVNIILTAFCNFVCMTQNGL